ncbi:PREDICTED: uncharacterized protein LOC108660557 [Theobroma cacao]|uniref:Uncharacterized protein LOC108660557 n=1 Tax=Theobroma cacao TaxID=3641 RepID=A0AB32VRQ2_THECC|nr:PREDICTED: uncharacterized protein LOC108660557 [Theobroma cacao]
MGVPGRNTLLLANTSNCSCTSASCFFNKAIFASMSSNSFSNEDLLRKILTLDLQSLRHSSLNPKLQASSKSCNICCNSSDEALISGAWEMAKARPNTSIIKQMTSTFFTKEPFQAHHNGSSE